jgi:hypothetical protein
MVDRYPKYVTRERPSGNRSVPEERFPFFQSDFYRNKAMGILSSSKYIHMFNNLTFYIGRPTFVGSFPIGSIN